MRIMNNETELNRSLYCVKQSAVELLPIELLLEGVGQKGGNRQKRIPIQAMP